MDDTKLLNLFGSAETFEAIFKKWTTNQKNLFRKLVVAVHEAGYDWYWVNTEPVQLRIGRYDTPEPRAKCVIAELPLTASQLIKLRDGEAKPLAKSHIDLFTSNTVIQTINGFRLANGNHRNFICNARKPPNIACFPIDYNQLKKNEQSGNSCSLR